MANDLMRFSVAMPEDLLVSFDRLVSRRGLAKNRSEVVRDLVRDALVEDECAMPGVEVAGSLTIVFDLVTAIAVGMLITVVLFMKIGRRGTEVKGWTYFVRQGLRGHAPARAAQERARVRDQRPDVLRQ